MEIDTTDLALAGAPDASPILSRQTAASGVKPKREKCRSRSPPSERYRRASATHGLQEKIAETMADHLLIFKNDWLGQFSQSLNGQRGTFEASTSALAQNMLLLTGGQQMLQQEMGQVKHDVLHSLEFPEHQMRGEEAWKAAYAEVSPLVTRISQRERSSGPPEKEMDMESSLPFDGRTRAKPKPRDLHRGTSAPEFYPDISQEQAPPSVF